METTNKTNEVKDALDQTKEKAQSAVAGAKDKAEGVIKDVRTGADPDHIRADYEALKADFQTLRSDVMSMVENLKGSAATKAKEVSADLRESGGHITQRAMEAAQQAKEKGGELAESLEARVKDRPLMSVLVAFGAGIVLSRLLRH